MAKSVSIRRRLVWYVLVTTLVMSVVTGVGVYRGTTHEADEIFDAALVQTARILDGLLTRQAIEANRHDLEQALDRAVSVKNRENRNDEEDEDEDEDENEDEELHAYEKKLFFLIQESNGEVLLKSHFAPELTAETLTIEDANSGFDDIIIKNKGWITFTMRASDPGLWIVVGERSDVRKEVTEYIGSALLTPLVLILPVVLFFLWRIVSLALRPLQQAIDEVEQQDIKKLKKMTVENMPMEIKPLLEAINQMVEKLDEGYQRERRFVSDASHELRNPLAALLINVENALEENQDEDVVESLTSMKQSISRLSHLVSQLLLLSHSENPLSSQDFTSVDLNTLCQSVIETHKEKALTKRQLIQFESTDEDCHVKGVESLLNSLVSNLLDNAIKYCPEACEIKLACLKQNEDIVISVDDSGPGLNSELRTSVVDRFVRAEGTKETGAGLGLSIVKSITEIHEASMFLGDSRLGGLSVQIAFHRAYPS